MEKAFTLAEVLITLMIIGIVAVMTLKTLNYVQDLEYKTGYKKSFSDISHVFQQAITEGLMTPRIAQGDPNATGADWQILKDGMKISKDCTKADLYSCWAQGDTVNDSNGGFPHVGQSLSFIDAQGRSWVLYYDNESVFFVDINGFKKPNRFGKDRWMFIGKTTYNVNVTIGIPAKIANWVGDQTTNTNWCNYPPCYYKTWLYE